MDELSLLVLCIATGSQVREQVAGGLAGAVARLRRIGQRLGPLRGDSQYSSGLSIHTGTAASLSCSLVFDSKYYYLKTLSLARHGLQ